MESRTTRPAFRAALGERPRLAVIVWAVLLAQVLLYPGIPDLVVHLGAADGLDGGRWFLVAEFGAFVGFAWVWGHASDTLGRRVPLIVAGSIGSAVGYAVLAAAPALGLGFDAVLAVRAFQGAASIGAFSLAMTMLMDLDGGHGQNMGAAGIAIGLGTAMGAPLGGQLSEVAPELPLLAAAALMVAVAGAAASVTDRAPTGTRATAREAISRLRSRPALSIPYAFGFVDRLTAGFFALVGTLYFQTRFGLGAGDTGLMLALFFAPFALLQYPMGLLSDRIGRFVPVVAGSVLYGVTIVAVGLAPSVATAAGAMVAVGVAGALVAPATMALVTDVAGARDRGVAMAGFNVFGSLGFLAGFLYGAAVAEAHGFTAAFLATGLLEVGIAVVALRGVRRVAGRSPTESNQPGTSAAE